MSRGVVLVGRKGHAIELDAIFIETVVLVLIKVVVAQGHEEPVDVVELILLVVIEDYGLLGRACRGRFLCKDHLMLKLLVLIIVVMYGGRLAREVNIEHVISYCYQLLLLFRRWLLGGWRLDEVVGEAL